MTPQSTPTPTPEQAHSGSLLPAPCPSSPEATSGASRPRRLNAYRHGLTAQVLLFTPEEHPLYLKHCAELKSHYLPYGPVEERLAQSIADLHWRLQRATAIENSMFALGQSNPADPTGIDAVDSAFSHARTWMMESKNLALLTLYEHRIERKLEKNIAALESEQQRRHAAYDQAMHTAKRLYQFAEANGLDYDPEAYFTRPPRAFKSVFSADFVAREIHRDQLERLSFPPRTIPELPENFRRKKAA